MTIISRLSTITSLGFLLLTFTCNVDATTRGVRSRKLNDEIVIDGDDDAVVEGKAAAVSKKKKKTNAPIPTVPDPTQCGLDQGCVMAPDYLFYCLAMSGFQMGAGGNVIRPFDGVAYQEAKTTWTGVRYPAAVVYASTTDEVSLAMNCARVSGYKVSPRGKGHSFGAFSTMDGYLVIDMTRTCKTESITHDDTFQEDHLIKDSRVIGTLTLPSGCSNALVVAETNKRFPGNAIGLAGSCPSVGITGFILGGGGGDASPFVGYAADVVKSFEIVLPDGRIVTASAEENEDLFWASRGGGGGNGIITQVEYKIIEAPRDKFTVLDFQLDTLPGDPNGALKIAKFMDFFLYRLTNKVSSRFGGEGFLYGPTGVGSPDCPDNLCVTAKFSFLYLGSYEQATKDIKRLFLPKLKDLVLTVDLPFPMPSRKVFQNYQPLCVDQSCRANPGLSKDLDISAVEFNTYAEAQAYKICTANLWQNPITTGINEDTCASLGIHDENCIDLPFVYEEVQTATIMTRRMLPSSCLNQDVIAAIVDNFGKPEGFINQPGPSREWVEYFAKETNIEDIEKAYVAYARMDPSSSRGYAPPTRTGGYMVPQVKPETLARILLEVDEISINHFMQAAPLKIKSDESAYPHRDSALMCDTRDKLFSNPAKTQVFNILREDEGIRPKGYYAYVGPIVRSWRQYYFGDNYERLSNIRGKYDPFDMFGKPMTPESVYDEDFE